MAAANITAVILAGGLATRMGGADKGLVTYQGQRMIELVLARVTPQVQHVLINANRHLATYQAIAQTVGAKVITDMNNEYNGPLAGIQAGMHHAITELIVSIPCDTPLLPMTLVNQLKQTLTYARANVAIARTAHRTHPVFCLCHKQLASNLDDFLNAGHRKVSTWQTQQNHVYAEFESEQAFTNINSLTRETKYVKIKSYPSI